MCQFTYLKSLLQSSSIEVWGHVPICLCMYVSIDSIGVGGILHVSSLQIWFTCLSVNNSQALPKQRQTSIRSFHNQLEGRISSGRFRKLQTILGIVYFLISARFFIGQRRSRYE